MNSESNITERINNWMKHSVTLKLISITILILLLLIPSSMISSIIHERENLSQEAISEVSSKWANAQLIKGPVLSIPLIYELEKKDGMVELTRYLHVLPEELNINGKIDPEKLKRGIYEVVVYKSNLSVNGSFSPKTHIDRNNLREIKWNQAFITIGISDLRGIKEDIILDWNMEHIKAEPGSKIADLISSGVTIDLPKGFDPAKKSIDFQFNLQLQGSENMSFVPLGGTTNIQLESEWNSPSFNGNFLPNDRSVTQEGFTANWKVLQLNRNYPQQWIGDQYSQSLNQSAFGLDLILPLDDYHKTIRSAKYAIMTIALTFLIFFLVEILHGRKIHAFQYTLVGLSLCLFYILLISISEHSNFNFAYGISSLAIISMISLYSMSVFQARKISTLLLVVLCGVYGFLFVTLQLADYALLMGAVGLTTILGATMYFTRNVNWFDLSNQKLKTSAE